MITGIDLNETVDYVCKADKKDPTIWKLGPLTSSAMASIAQASVNNADSMTQMIRLVQAGLKGWSNFKTGDKDIEYATGPEGVLKSIIDIIPLNVITELGTEILRINNLSEEEQKN